MDSKIFNSTPGRPRQNVQAALDLVRGKVNSAYQDKFTPANFQTKPRQLSKHQTYMQSLQNSGMSLVEIQTAWHNYYMALTDAEKHEVWKEFYASNQHTQYQQIYSQTQAQASSSNQNADTSQNQANAKLDPTQMAPIAPAGRMLNIPGRIFGTKILRKPSKQQEELTGFSAHIQSIAFGLSMGGLTLLVILFTFFNQFVITPFIRPSTSAATGPIIITNRTTVQGDQTSLTLNKIDVQVPIDFTLTTNDEATIQKSLEKGIVHYANTAMPGQNGNGAYFGHSSMNIFSKGDFKFTFTRLEKVTEGDVFYITYQGKIYAYKVFAKEIVAPNQVSVLDDTKGKQATAILVTCNPPGFNTTRLVVWGEQISPSPSTNTQPTAPAPGTKPVTPPSLTSNNKPLWDELIDKVTFWN